MTGFIVATDSAGDVPIELCRQYGVHPLLMSYSFADEEYVDTLERDQCSAFYDRMRAGEIPRTSQPNPTQFVAFWESIMEGDLPIVHICLGGGVSGTVQSGRIAVEMMRELHPQMKVYFIDSGLESFAYGYFAIEAAKLAQAGKSAEEAVAFLEREMPRANAYFTTGDLSYLYRSGRLNRVGFAAAKALNIWPILRFDTVGHLLVHDKCRGKKATYARILELVGETVEDAEQQTLYFVHTDCYEQAKELAEAVRARFGFRDTVGYCIGPTIGTHAGPGLMAVYFMGKPRFD